MEPLPFPQHGPGPIQRPTRLACPPTQPTSFLRLPSYLQSPGSPDVLDQINRLLHQQGNTPAPAAANLSNGSIASPIGNEMNTPNFTWTSFSPTEWFSKYDSWPSTNIQSPTVSLTTQVQNPFALMATPGGHQRQPSREEAAIWSTALGTVTPRFAVSSTRTQRASTWNDLFSSTVPSSTESIRLPMNPLKSWSAPDPASTDGLSLNAQETVASNQVDLAPCSHLTSHTGASSAHRHGIFTRYRTIPLFHRRCRISSKHRPRRAGGRIHRPTAVARIRINSIISTMKRSWIAIDPDGTSLVEVRAPRLIYFRP